MGQKTLGCCVVLSLFSIVLLLFVLIMLVADPILLGVEQSVASKALLSTIINLVFFALILAICVHYMLTGYFVLTVLKNLIKNCYRRLSHGNSSSAIAESDEWYTVLPQNASEFHAGGTSGLMRFKNAPHDAPATNPAKPKGRNSLFKTKSRRHDPEFELSSFKNEMQPLVSGSNTSAIGRVYS